MTVQEKHAECRRLLALLEVRQADEFTVAELRLLLAPLPQCPDKNDLVLDFQERAITDRLLSLVAIHARFGIYVLGGKGGGG